MTRLLVIEHETDAPMALLGEWLTEEEIELDVIRPYLGEQLPASLGRHAGLLVLGGEMGATEDDRAPWLVPTRELVRTATDLGLPTLGICLGHQLLAVALGGKVGKNLAGRQQGLIDFEVVPDAIRDPLLCRVLERDPRPRVVHWNDDIVTELPPGATMLARAGGAVQAACFGAQTWGLQSHPEVDHRIVASWSATDTGAAAVRARAALDQIEAAEPELRRSWRPLATAFAALLRAG